MEQHIQSDEIIPHPAADTEPLESISYEEQKRLDELEIKESRAIGERMIQGMEKLIETNPHIKEVMEKKEDNNK